MIGECQLNSFLKSQKSTCMLLIALKNGTKNEPSFSFLPLLPSLWNIGFPDQLETQFEASSSSSPPLQTPSFLLPRHYLQRKKFEKRHCNHCRFTGLGQQDHFGRTKPFW